MAKSKQRQHLKINSRMVDSIGNFMLKIKRLAPFLNASPEILQWIYYINGAASIASLPN